MGTPNQRRWPSVVLCKKIPFSRNDEKAGLRGRNQFTISVVTPEIPLSVALIATLPEALAVAKPPPADATVKVEMGVKYFSIRTSCDQPHQVPRPEFGHRAILRLRCSNSGESRPGVCIHSSHQVVFVLVEPQSQLLHL